MNFASKSNYAIYAIVINLILVVCSCKKHPETATHIPTKTSPKNKIPADDDPKKELIVTSLFPNKIKRYGQKSQNSCLITSIYMLVHSIKGVHTAVSENGAEYGFDGHKKASPTNELLLATSNGLEQGFLGGGGDFPDPKKDYSSFKNFSDDIAALLTVGPFVLGDNGHAVLVIGIDKSNGTLIYIDPMHSNINSCISVFALNRIIPAEFYYLTGTRTHHHKHYTPTQEEENHFLKLKSIGTTKPQEEYKF
jgi:hypothetical protein